MYHFDVSYTYKVWAFFSWMYVYVWCIYVYMLMMICVQGVYTWRPHINVECLLQSFSALFFETESLWDEISLVWLARLTRQWALGICLSPLPRRCTQHITTVSSFSHRCGGSRIRCSHLHNKRPVKLSPQLPTCAIFFINF